MFVQSNTSARRRGRTAARLAAAAALALAGLGAAAGQASAALITSFSAGVLNDENVANPQSSDYFTQAGGHPDVAFTKFTLNTSDSAAEFVRVDLPAGLTVNSFWFTGRVRGRRLRAGSYQLEARATYPGGARSAPRQGALPRQGLSRTGSDLSWLTKSDSAARGAPPSSIRG